jgi:hypothetical protein
MKMILQPNSSRLAKRNGFTPALAIDFAVNDVACSPVVQPMFYLHLLHPM